MGSGVIVSKNLPSFPCWIEPATGAVVLPNDSFVYDDFTGTISDKWSIYTGFSYTNNTCYGTDSTTIQLRSSKSFKGYGTLKLVFGVFHSNAAGYTDTYLRVTDGTNYHNLIHIQSSASYLRRTYFVEIEFSENTVTLKSCKYLTSGYYPDYSSTSTSTYDISTWSNAYLEFYQTHSSDKSHSIALTAIVGKIRESW